MVFDHNSVPKDLRPHNLPRTLADEPRIVAAVAAPAAACPSAVNGAASTTGRSPEFFTNLEGSIPLMYPATVPESGFVGLGYGNPTTGISTWVPRVPVPVPVAVPLGGVNVPSVGYGYGTNFGNRVVGNAVDHAGSSDMVAGYGYTPNLGNRVNANGSNELSNSGFSNSPSLGNRGSGSGSAADQGSEDGADDSVSGKKLKLLCSFGGKILPRPSDGMLRYVGGQTRIISMRRDVSFTDILRKMMDVYGQPVVIKYQLPDEDLDSLVSISCSDDLDNMMDEYEKLVERSSDGSAKLRVFLFSASQLDTSGVVQFGDLQDSGQRYVEAVNGIADGVGPIGGGITRRGSITSATSTQNSDFSVSDTVDNLAPGQGDTIGLPSTSVLSPRGYSASSSDSNARIVSADPNPPMYAEASAMLSGIPVGKSGPPQSLYSHPQVEYDRSVPATVPQQQMGHAFQQAGMGSPSHPPHLQAYVDPRQEILNHADYRHLPPQSGFPNTHLLGTTGSVFAPQHFRDGNSVATPHPYIPAVHMTMTQSSPHDTVRPTVVQPLMQHQPSQFEHYRDENAFGTRIVQLPVEPRYNAYQQQHLPTNVGGYGWQQVHQPEHVVFSDGLVPPHQQVIFSDKIPRSDDCYLCHKALPHAHSDPLVQNQRECGASPLCDLNTVHHSLLLEDSKKAHPANRVMVAGAFREGSAEQVPSALVVLSHVHPQVRIPQSDTVVSHNLEALHDTRKMDNSDQPKITVPQGMMRLPGDAPSPYIMLTGGIPPSHQDDSVHQPSVPTQYQVEQETTLRKPMNSDVLHISGVPIQAPEHLVHEAPKESFGKLSPPVPREHILDPTISHDQLRPVGEMMEGLQMRNSETDFNNEQNQSPVDRFRKEEVLDHISEQIAGREVLVDSTFIRPQVVLDSNHNKPTEVLPTSIEVSYVHSSRPLEPYGVVQPSVYSNSVPYPQSMMGNHLLNSPQVGPGIPALSVGDPTYVTDRTLPVAEWKNDVSRLEPNNCLGDGEASSSTVISSSFSPCSRVGDVQDSSNSLFSNQDPWSIRNDGQFPPPRPCKISTRKEASGTRDPLSENHFNTAVDLIKEDGATQVLSNPNKDFSAENSRSSRGSAEELIRQELQAVAEGVAASVFTSNPDSTANEGSEFSYGGNRDSEIADKDIGMQHKAKFEDMKNKLPEKGNLRFPVSEGIGCLQIIKNSDLEELRELGSGTFGTVYHGKWRGTDVAIKRINDRCFSGKSSEQDRMMDDFWNEAIKLADLHHPNVVAFYGVVLDGSGGSVATVTEYMVNGSLRNALQKKERNLDKRKRMLIAMDVAFGMEYLHGKSIVHFDLKSDNLLVNLRDPHRPICKVGDLGLSKVKCQTLISGGVRGTLPWMAPELLNGSSSLVSEKVDVFSFGIVLWELLTGEEPYADLHYGAIIGGIVSNTLRPPVPESCEPEWRLLMERCWSAEPSDRPNFTVIANELRAMASKTPSRGQNLVQQ